jgi:hypothetical protein
MITGVDVASRGSGDAMARRSGCAIHRLCVTAVEKPADGRFHVKRRRWIMLRWSEYPQGARASY